MITTYNDTVPRMTHEEWTAKAIELFGPKGRDWKFKCPICGHVQSGQGFIDRCGMTPEQAMQRAYFSCEGRWNKDVGCDYTLGGLFTIPGVLVNMDGKERPAFAFAGKDEPLGTTRYNAGTKQEGRAL